MSAESLVRIHRQAKALFFRNHIYKFEGMQLRVFWHIVMPCLPIILYNALSYLGVFQSTAGDIPRAVSISVGITFYFVFSESLVGCCSTFDSNKDYISKTGIEFISCYLSVLYTVLMNFSIRYICIAAILLYYSDFQSSALFWGPVVAMIAAFFSMSLGSMVSLFTVFYKDIVNVIQMMAFYMLFASGVFGKIDLDTTIGKVVSVLPGYIFVDEGRNLVLGLESNAFALFSILVGLSFILCGLSIVFHRNAKTLILNFIK